MATSPDPMIRECADKYTSAIRRVTVLTLAENLKLIRVQMNHDLANFDQILGTTRAPEKGQRTATSSMRTAASANREWLRGPVSKVLSQLDALAK